MTGSAFASLGSSMFATMVKARQKYVALQREHDAAMDACICDRGRCKCDAKEGEAWKRYQDAGAERAEREASWAEYQSIRWS